MSEERDGWSEKGRSESEGGRWLLFQRMRRALKTSSDELECEKGSEEVQMEKRASRLARRSWLGEGGKEGRKLSSVVGSLARSSFLRNQIFLPS